MLSDGRGTLPERLSLHGRLHYIPMGLSGENQAISQFNLEYLAGGGLQAFIQVTNYGSQPAQRRLDVLADGRVVSVYDLDAAGRRHAVGGRGRSTGDGGQIEARLEGSDLLAADDAAFAVVRRPAPVKVVLVSSGSLFLRTVLSLLPNVELTAVQPGDALPEGQADLVILRPQRAGYPARGAARCGLSPPRKAPHFSA